MLREVVELSQESGSAAGFEAAEDKFESAVAAAIAAAPQDVDALKAQVGAIGQACAGCHETFRRPSS